MTNKKPIPPEVQARIDLRKAIEATYKNLKQVPAGYTSTSKRRD